MHGRNNGGIRQDDESLLDFHVREYVASHSNKFKRLINELKDRNREILLRMRGLERGSSAWDDLRSAYLLGKRRVGELEKRLDQVDEWNLRGAKTSPEAQRIRAELNRVSQQVDRLQRHYDKRVDNYMMRDFNARHKQYLEKMNELKARKKELKRQLRDAP